MSGFFDNVCIAILLVAWGLAAPAMIVAVIGGLVF